MSDLSETLAKVIQENQELMTEDASGTMTSWFFCSDVGSVYDSTAFKQRFLYYCYRVGVNPLGRKKVWTTTAEFDKGSGSYVQTSGDELKMFSTVSGGDWTSELVKTPNTASGADLTGWTYLVWTGSYPANTTLEAQVLEYPSGSVLKSGTSSPLDLGSPFSSQYDVKTKFVFASNATGTSPVVTDFEVRWNPAKIGSGLGAWQAF